MLPPLLAFFQNEEEKIRNSEQNPNRVLLAHCLGGAFSSPSCLLVHPFRDANGRLARLLLSFLLRNYTVVPISLYYQGNRKLYLDALEERGNGTRVPWSVIEYVIKCSVETTGAAERYLMAEDN